MIRFELVAAGLFTLAIALATTSARAENDSRTQLPGVFETVFKKKEKPAVVSDDTRKNDEILAKRSARKKFKVASNFEPQLVSFSGYKAGTIVIDTKKKYLYLVERWGKARRYGVAVGREGLQFKGNAKIYEKQEWPRWIPTKDMIKRQPGKYAKYKDGMDGGPNNPLGARALYLYQGQVDTRIRIHGTNQPGSIGRAASNGCFRMVNEHVIDLYERVKVGANVVVL